MLNRFHNHIISRLRTALSLHNTVIVPTWPQSNNTSAISTTSARCLQPPGWNTWLFQELSPEEGCTFYFKKKKETQKRVYLRSPGLPRRSTSSPPHCWWKERRRPAGGRPCTPGSRGRRCRRRTGRQSCSGWRRISPRNFRGGWCSLLSWCRQTPPRQTAAPRHREKKRG